jgi:hypothetical protein
MAYRCLQTNCNNFNDGPIWEAVRKRWEYQKYQLKDDGEWRPIPGFENYELNSCGVIRNKKSYAGSTRTLVQTLRNNKYFYVTLTNSEGKRVGYPMDRLMAITFFGKNSKCIRTVIHIDHIKHNNQLSNLKLIEYNS